MGLSAVHAGRWGYGARRHAGDRFPASLPLGDACSRVRPGFPRRPRPAMPALEVPALEAPAFEAPAYEAPAYGVPASEVRAALEMPTPEVPRRVPMAPSPMSWPQEEPRARLPPAVRAVHQPGSAPRAWSLLQVFPLPAPPAGVHCPGASRRNRRARAAVSG